MVSSIIIFLTSFLCSYYIYIKTTDSAQKPYQICISVLYGSVISVLSSFLSSIHNPFNRILFLLLSVTFFFIINKHRVFTAIPLSIISLGISYGIEIISVIIISTIYYFIGFNESIISDFITSLLQFIFVFMLMRIKRFRKGFNIFYDKNNFGLGLVLSGIIVCFEAYNKNELSTLTIDILAFGILLFSIGLFLWIRSAITKHYRKRLKLRAEEYSKIELTEKEKEIEKLSDENTSLSSIIHLDNHIIQSIESELKALNSTELTDKLLISINQRNEYVNDLLIKSKNLASTGNADIDAFLADLYIKAASRGIDYNLNTDCDINYLLNNIIPVSGFEALLRNLITNSIVDIENNSDTPGRISIKISQPNDIYELTVMDNGISKENNNSIPDIVEKSNASILINNFDNNDSFTKTVTIRFDGLKTHC